MSEWDITKRNAFFDTIIEENQYLIEIKKEFNELVNNFLSYNDWTREYYYYFDKILKEAEKIDKIKKLNILINYLKQIRKWKEWKDIIKINFLILEINNIKYKKKNNKISEKKEKKESSFNIKWWDCWKYVFTKENYEYLWNDEYKISLDFLKWNNNSNSLNFENYIIIKYLWDNIMKYFDKEWKELWEITIVVIDWLNDIKNAVFQINNWKEKLEISLYLDFEKK